MKLMIFAIYGFLLAVALLLLALVWHAQMPGVYFVCPNRGVISDFLPPFVDPGVNGCFFMRPPSVVYLMWGVYIAVGVIVPGFGAWLINRLHQRALKKSWM
jgi:hypothetical protein